MFVYPGRQPPFGMSGGQASVDCGFLGTARASYDRVAVGGVGRALATQENGEPGVGVAVDWGRFYESLTVQLY
jgi:hypothetical protein